MIPIVKSTAINIALFAFISLNPYFRWLVPNEVFYLVFFLSTLFFTYQLKLKILRGMVFENWRKRIGFGVLFFVVYFTTSVVHDMRWGHFFWFIPFIFIIFYNNYIINESFKFFKKIILFFSIAAITFWIFNQLNIPIPFFSYKPEFRYNENDYYRVYGFALSLYRGNLPVGGIYGIERITGIFAEPGHFGLYLGSILAIEKFNFTSRSNRIFLITGILTFSTAFYGILFLGFLYNALVNKTISKELQISILILTVSFLFGVLIGGNGFKELTYGRVVKQVDDNVGVIDILESRTHDGFIEIFDEFIKTEDVFLGYGYAKYDTIIQTTNWRGLVYRFGIIGFIIMLLLMLTIVSGGDFYYSLLFIAIFFLILSHRSYLLYTPWFYILAFWGFVLNREGSEKIEYIIKR